MKHYLLAFFCIIFAFKSTKTYCQEEFFGNRPGLSPYYLQGFNQKAYGYGCSAYFKKGISLGIGVEQVATSSIPTLSMIYYTKLDTTTNGVRFVFGPSYSYIDPYNILGINFGILGGLFPESDFPSSISLSSSLQIPFTKNGFSTSRNNPPYFNNSSPTIEISPVIGLGFTQAFFATKTVYPIVHISTAYNLRSSINLVAGAIGLNIRL
jgi:hypothetical protein